MHHHTHLELNIVVAALGCVVKFPEIDFLFSLLIGLIKRSKLQMINRLAQVALLKENQYFGNFQVNLKQQCKKKREKKEI